MVFGPVPVLAFTTRIDTSLACVSSEVTEHPEGTATIELTARMRTNQRALFRFTTGSNRSSDKLMSSSPFSHQPAPGVRRDSWLMLMVSVETPDAESDVGEKAQEYPCGIPAAQERLMV